MASKYTVKTGESFSLELNTLDGSAAIVSDVTLIEAALKKAASNGVVPSQSTPHVAMFVVETTSKGWSFSLSSSVTASLTPGMYVMDARLVLTSGDVVITDPVQIEIRGSVT